MLFERQKATVTCASLCLDRHAQTVTVNSNRSSDILTEVTLQEIVDRGSLSCHNSSSGPCSITFNISWTDDLDLREKLNELHCTFIYTGGGHCKTDNIMIAFSGK